MMFKIEQKQNNKVLRKLTALLVAGGYCMMATHAYSHPEKSNKEQIEEQINEVTDKRKQMRAKAQKLRDNAQERSSAMRIKTSKRRELQKQKMAEQRAKADKQKIQLQAFKTQLLEMLLSDGVIKSETEDVEVTYSDNAPVANNVNLSAQFGNRYVELWAEHNRVISEKSYIFITLGSYEIREITLDGKSFHFVTQTN